MPALFTSALMTARSKGALGANIDGVLDQTGPRGGKYGEQYGQSMFPGLHALADEGSVFVATNPTIGTALTASITTAFSDTATIGLFALQNAAPAGASGIRIYPLWYRLIVAQVPASATSWNFAIKMENAIRTPSANNVAITPVNVNQDDNTQSVAKLQSFNAASLTWPASGNTARTTARGALGGLPILGDELVVLFGSAGDAAFGSSGTASRKCTVVAPHVIGPQQTMSFSHWAIANASTAGTYEFELCWVER